jgi:hypothetical protein
MKILHIAEESKRYQRLSFSAPSVVVTLIPPLTPRSNHCDTLAPNTGVPNKFKYTERRLNTDLDPTSSPSIRHKLEALSLNTLSIRQE